MGSGNVPVSPPESAAVGDPFVVPTAADGLDDRIRAVADLRQRFARQGETGLAGSAGLARIAPPWQ